MCWRKAYIFFEVCIYIYIFTEVSAGGLVRVADAAKTRRLERKCATIELQ